MKRKLYDKCMGECCEDIGIKVSPERLEASYMMWLSSDRYSNAEDIKRTLSFSNTLNIYSDIHLIYPAWVFIKSDCFHPESPKKKNKEIIYHYTCKHFDKKKRICNIYNIRPKVCRTYPDNGVCNNPKCRWKKQIGLRKEYEKKKHEQDCKVKKEIKEVKRGIGKLNEKK